MKDVLEMMSVCLTKTFQDSIVCAIEDYARHEDILGWVLQRPTRVPTDLNQRDAFCSVGLRRPLQFASVLIDKMI